MARTSLPPPLSITCLHLVVFCSFVVSFLGCAMIASHAFRHTRHVAFPSISVHLGIPLLVCGCVRDMHSCVFGLLRYRFNNAVTFGVGEHTKTPH